MPREPLWTDEEVELLRSGAAEGATQAELAEEFGRSLPAVSHKASKLGIRFRRGRPVDVYRRATVLNLIREGKSLRQIKAETGYCWESIRLIINEYTTLGVLVRVGGQTRSVRYVLFSDPRSGSDLRDAS
jgi:hypothetical protein